MTHRLLKFKFYGIKNIQKEICLDFFNEYPSKKALEEESHIKALYGPNGSGKTAVCLAMHYYKKMCTDNRFLATDEAKGFTSSLNKKTKKFYCDVTFYCFFDGSDAKRRIYRHIIEVAHKNNQLTLLKEELYVLGPRKEMRPIYLFSDEKGLYEDRNKTVKEYASGDLLSSITARVLNKLFSIENDSEGLTFANKNIEILAPGLFSLMLQVEFGEKSDVPKDYSFLYDDKNWDIKKRMLRLASDNLDSHKLGFDEIINSSEKKKFEKKLEKLSCFVKKMKPDLTRIKPEYYKINVGVGLTGVKLIFVYDDTEVDYKFESSGVKKIVRLFDLFTLASSKRNVVVIDEIDADVHDLFLCSLLDYFIRYTSTQLFITTHNIDLMNNIKSLKHSIDFLSQDNVLTSWANNGKKSPKRNYLGGMVSHIPFNLFSSDFAEIFENEE